MGPMTSTSTSAVVRLRKYCTLPIKLRSLSYFFQNKVEEKVNKTSLVRNRL